jgi:hypothetical protein
VTGVARATERLRSGQRVRVNGSSGRIDVLSDDDDDDDDNDAK